MEKGKCTVLLVLMAIVLTCVIPSAVVPVFAATTANGVLDLEAEKCWFDPASWASTEATKFSGGFGLRVSGAEDKTTPGSTPSPTSTNPTPTPRPTAPGIDFSFTADMAGTYHIWVRNTATTSSGQNCFVSLNNGAYNYVGLQNNNTATPVWTKLGSQTASANGTVNVRIIHRQVYGIVFDRFYITTNAAYTPNDTDLPNKPYSPPPSLAVTTHDLTYTAGSINGWYGMTAGAVLADVTVANDITKEIYNANGSVAAPSAAAAEGMYVRAAYSSQFADYPLVYAKHRVGEVTYSIAGANGANPWNANGYNGAKLNVTATIDSFTSEVSQDYTLIVAENNNGVLNRIVTDRKTVNAKGSFTLTINHDISNGNTADYRIFLWDSFSSLSPLKEAYVNTPKLAGKKMICFGDSITNGFMTYPSDLGLINGMFYSSNSAQTHIYNVGVAGARMSLNTSDATNSCSMASLTAAFSNPAANLAAQYAYLSSSGVSGWTNTTFTYSNMTAAKAAIADVDYATVFYGTNDYASNIALDNASNPYDTTTFGGATRYSIEQLLGANPDMQILLIAPMYRDRMTKVTDTNTDKRNSDEYSNGNGVYLRAYGDKLEEIAAGYDHVYFYGFYDESGINKWNQADYFYDGLHPISPTQSSPMYPSTSPGHRLLASKISNAMQRFFR